MEYSLEGKLETIGAIRKFMLAGRARLTIRSLKTQTRFTYRVKAAPEVEGADPLKDEALFVSVLTGPENETDYQFVGTIFKRPDGALVYRHSRKSRIDERAKSVVAFAWLVRMLAQANDMVLAQAEVWHEGVCGRCGRTLTVPESVASGFGPECIGKL